MRVYIAGPMTTSGDIVTNTKKAVDLANTIRNLGHFPFVPQLSTFWHYVHERDYEDWMEWDFKWLELCDVMVRIPGKSKGADREEEFARKRGIQVYSPTKFMNTFGATEY